jgi:hypothetical protein
LRISAVAVAIVEAVQVIAQASGEPGGDGSG